MNREQQRLLEDRQRLRNWKRWGPYLSERQWGTVREDYCADGDSWSCFPHDHARSRAYRWGEDGILGISDRECRLCFALALWNGNDPILKERLFGLANTEGNHGEDCKEQYFYLDSTPTHSYLKGLYKYPQAAFPYARLVEENRRRGRREPELELCDTGVFDGNRYFDVFAEYAKASPDDILIQIKVVNRGSERATLHLIPTLWYRNTWSWDGIPDGAEVKPHLRRQSDGSVLARHSTLGRFRFVADRGPDGNEPEWLFTENDTNVRRLFHVENSSPYVKDAFHERVVGGQTDAVNPRGQGTKVGAWYVLPISAGGSITLRMRLTAEGEVNGNPWGAPFEAIVAGRRAEANEFFDDVGLRDLPREEQNVVRQSFAGLLWSKQFYHYVVKDWLEGDVAQPPPPFVRKFGRNSDWPHLFNRDVISMPDKWEFPWYASWDLAFQMIAFAQVDPQFAKEQLVLFLREWYMHPNGQIPAYELALSDTNPPVHAWACWRVYKMTGPRWGRDTAFLRRCFLKLLLNFTWWVNRKDPEGRNLFSGGFLGLDNIGVFDRSKPWPAGGRLEQADGTAWMAFYCGTMLSMALELAREDSTYEDLASKFFEHFVAITDAMNSLGGTGLWDEEDGFYYDEIRLHGQSIPLRLRSLVGIVPLFAVEILDAETLALLPGFRKRTDWFLENRGDLAMHISYMDAGGCHAEHRLLAIPSRERLLRVLHYVLDERELLSPYGIRSLSKIYSEKPFRFALGDEVHEVEYAPGESTTNLFGGNSNWRGPIWFPLNYLLIEALERYHHFYGDELKVECPTGSGRLLTLSEVASEIRSRLASLFLPAAGGRRPCHGDDTRFATDPAWKDLVLFHEHFHADTGRGLGASHQTGWTALAVQMFLNDPHRHR